MWLFPGPTFLRITAPCGLAGLREGPTARFADRLALSCFMMLTDSCTHFSEGLPLDYGTRTPLRDIPNRHELRHDARIGVTFAIDI
jgi:hypothetical protein